MQIRIVRCKRHGAKRTTESKKKKKERVEKICTVGDKLHPVTEYGRSWAGREGKKEEGENWDGVVRKQYGQGLAVPEGVRDGAEGEEYKAGTRGGEHGPRSENHTRKEQERDTNGNKGLLGG